MALKRKSQNRELPGAGGLAGKASARLSNNFLKNWRHERHALDRALALFLGGRGEKKLP
jgi:hypothetical protein